MQIKRTRPIQTFDLKLPGIEVMSDKEDSEDDEIRNEMSPESSSSLLSVVGWKINK